MKAKVRKELAQRSKQARLIEFHANRQGGFPTTSLFWDCECEHGYIHPANTPMCYGCRAVRDEQPDSRVNEVLANSHEFALDKGVISLLRELQCEAEPMAIPY